MAVPALAQSKPNLINDPEWQKRFLGSYGFLSGAEPDVNAGELEVLREVIDLMRVNPDGCVDRAAAARRARDSSAALDFILANLQFQNGKLEDAVEELRSWRSRSSRTSAAPTRTSGLLRVQKQRLQGRPRAPGACRRAGRSRRSQLRAHRVLLHPGRELPGRRIRLPQRDPPGAGHARLEAGARPSAAQGMKQAPPSRSRSSMPCSPRTPRTPSPGSSRRTPTSGSTQPRAAAVNLEAVRMLGKATSRARLVLLGDIYMNEQSLSSSRRTPTSR